ncbi:gamma-glutamyltransferase family protein [Hyphomonas sp.]|uniref:gamma-glutamyltransferase family protein n=1 Tax=Hyphomonas sp. TaxID=87 RepID=UPI0025BFEF38|nr:gamma-glutamyltransferase family protein [Hyphomonas sp.]
MMRNLIAGGFGALILSACVMVHVEEDDAPALTAAAIEPAASTEPAAPGPGGRMPSGRDLGVRSAVVAPNGAAATAHPLATQTAIDVLKAGGSAMDAAIAANAMLGLVEPTANGIGGDLFAIVWDPKTQKLYGYNGSGRSPMDATLADMQAYADKFMDGKEIPPHGTAPLTVPGTVDAWYALHAKFGKRPMADNLQPAIDYARNGAPIPEVIAYYWGRSAVAFPKSHASGMLEEFENARKLYFDPPPREGTLFRNPDLANTLETIAKKGRDEFYKGIMAKNMAAYIAGIGGHLDYDDFNVHEGEWTEPYCVTYREDYKVCELGPNTQGIAALQMLQMLEKFDLRSMGFGSADSLMAQVEAKRLAFTDRARFYADPAFTRFEPKALIDPARTARQSALIDTGTAMQAVPIEPFGAEDLAAFDGAEADTKLKDGDTTYLTVTDKDGMMVSLIQSNYRGMGSGLVPDGLGFMFQDRGQLFSLDPAHPNVWAPGKRPFHTIIPAFAFKKDMPSCQVRAVPIEQACPFEPWLSFGLMGGAMQPQGHVQIILNLVDYDMGLQEAGDAARWEHVGGCEPTNALDGDSCEANMGVVQIEGGIPEATKAELEARGHKVEYIRANAGGYQAIMRDFETGAWIAATEMRKDGAADGY